MQLRAHLRRVPERFADSPYLAADYRRMTEDRGVQPLPGGQLARRPIDAMEPAARQRYASDWERLDARQQAAHEAMSAPAREHYAGWRADFERANALPQAETTAEHAADMLGALIAAAASPEGLVGFVPPAVNGLAIVKQLPALARELARTIDAAVRSFRNRLGRNPTEAELRALIPNLSQKSIREAFQKGGRFEGRTVWDVRDDLRSGALEPVDVPLDVIFREGKPISLDNRSLAALRTAKADPRKIKVTDKTGNMELESYLTSRLLDDKLGPTGSETIRIRGAGVPNASKFRWPR